jgi:hypothetical protein
MRSVLFLLSLSTPVLAQPTLDHSSPAAISPKGGQITLHGTGLNQPLSLWSTPTTEAIFSSTSPDSATCRLTFPNPIQDQFLTFRLTTSSGISEPILIALDDLPTINANAKNKSAKQAQPIDLPIAVEGSIEELTSHFYKFPVRKGRTLSVDVIANRIGSKLDPLVRLLDSTGKELLLCDDDPSIAPDARFSYPISSDGEYILQIRDAAYEGSKEHRYRLRVKETETSETQLPPIRHYATTLPAVTEQEPNDSPAAATPFKLPAQLQGAFSKPHDRDIYQFPAKKGDHILIRSKTRSIGSPCDLFLRLAKSNGSKLADSKTDTADEASLDATIPEDGAYLLIVEEITGQSGPAMFYQLDVQPFAGFSLTTDTEKLDIPAGGQAELKITATRRDYKGPITLSLEGAPEGTRLLDDTIKENKNEAQIKIKLLPNASVGKPFSLRIIGNAKINGEDYTQPLSTYPALRKLFPLTHYPPPQLDGEIGLGIKPPLPTTTTSPTTKP